MLRIIESTQQVYERTLATAVGPNDGNVLAPADRQVHVLQHLRPAIVAETHVAKLDLVMRRLKRNGTFRLDDLRWSFQERVQKVGGSHAVVDSRDHARKLSQRVGGPHEHREKHRHERDARWLLEHRYAEDAGLLIDH